MSAAPVPRFAWVDSPWTYTWNSDPYSWRDISVALEGPVKLDVMSMLEEACLGMTLSEIFGLLPPLSTIKDPPADTNTAASFCTNIENVAVRQLQAHLVIRLFANPALIARFMNSSYRPSDLQTARESMSAGKPCRLQWNEVALKSFLDKIHALEGVLRFRRHFAHGPPQRAPETASETICNPNPSVLRTTLISAGLVASATGYVKTLNASSVPQYNVHFADSFSSHVIYALIVLVRPLMKYVLTRLEGRAKMCADGVLSPVG